MEAAVSVSCFFFQAEDGIRAGHVTGVQTCALPIFDFHAPPQEPGWANDGTVGDAGYSSVPWTVDGGTGSTLTWSSETIAQNPNANAIRWGTLYNFRFDSSAPPVTSNATIGFFKTGSPVTVAIVAPFMSDVTPTATPTSTATATPTSTATATATVSPTAT